MPKFIDLAGQKRGRLIVLKRVDNHKKGSVLYLCECSCGNIVEKTARDLSRLKEPSCGCARREARINLTGKRFGRLTVLEWVPSERGDAHWLCRCDCGTEKVVNGKSLRDGHSKSCGCYQREEVSQRMRNLTQEEKDKRARYSHRMSYSRIYRIYAGMKARCYSPGTTHYAHYGGRGITICDEWLEDFMNFYNWAMANGYEDHLSIDRIDVNGNYCPENCRWATQKEQCNNRRQNRFLKFNGETHTVKEWADITGINTGTLRNRLRAGWNIERALGEPVHKQYSRHET